MMSLAHIARQLTLHDMFYLLNYARPCNFRTILRAVKSAHPQASVRVIFSEIPDLRACRPQNSHHGPARKTSIACGNVNKIFLIISAINSDHAVSVLRPPSSEGPRSPLLSWLRLHAVKSQNPVKIRLNLNSIMDFRSTNIFIQTGFVRNTFPSVRCKTPVAFANYFRRRSS